MSEIIRCRLGPSGCVLTITPTAPVVCIEFCTIGHHQMVGKIPVE